MSWPVTPREKRIANLQVVGLFIGLAVALVIGSLVVTLPEILFGSSKSQNLGSKKEKVSS